MEENQKFILTLKCPDQIGIVARVSAIITKYGGWVTSAQQYGDETNGQFFMRVEIKQNSLTHTLDKFKEELRVLENQLNMTWSLVDTTQKKRTVIFVSKQSHCLSDLLYRYASHDLEMNVVGIISNYPDHAWLANAYGMNYYTIPFHEDTDNHSAYLEIEKLLNNLSVDLIILARFMRIFPTALCERYAGKIINIHHSFLPSFVGANSYARAYEAGVKMIGATCHYVTAALDEGPIIEQDVIRINHRHTVDQLTQLGRDIEKIVLARGVRYHLEERIMLNDNKTIIFD